MSSFSLTSSSDNAWHIRINDRAFDIPLDAQVDRPITRVFIVDGVRRAKDINVTLIRSQIEGLAFNDAHDFFKLIRLQNIGKNVQFELQLKKPLIDKFKAQDPVKTLSVN